MEDKPRRLVKNVSANREGTCHCECGAWAQRERQQPIEPASRLLNDSLTRIGSGLDCFCLDYLELMQQLWVNFGRNRYLANQHPRLRSGISETICHLRSFPVHGSRFSVAGAPAKRSYIDNSDDNGSWVVAQAVNTLQIAR